MNAFSGHSQNAPPGGAGMGGAHPPLAPPVSTGSSSGAQQQGAGGYNPSGEILAMLRKGASRRLPLSCEHGVAKAVFVLAMLTGRLCVQQYVCSVYL